MHGRAGATRALTRLARNAGVTHPISPHGLRRTFCTTGLVAGISIRDMRDLDRHGAHAVAASFAGMSTG